jgi:hypothetical protein
VKENLTSFINTDEEPSKEKLKGAGSGIRTHAILKGSQALKACALSALPTGCKTLIFHYPGYFPAPSSYFFDLFALNLYLQT